MIQGNPGTFQGSRKPSWQLLRHSSHSSMSGWAIITPHLDRGPDSEQVFGPSFVTYLTVPVCVKGGWCMCVRVCVLCVYVGGWVAYVHVCPCVCVWSVSVMVSVSYVCLCQCECDSHHFIMGRVCHIHHNACYSVSVRQSVLTLGHLVRIIQCRGSS